MTIQFYGVRGPNGFLSNFYHCMLDIDGVTYASVEHFYQSVKSLDPDVQEHIRSAGTAGEARRRGRACQLRADWEEVVGTPTLAAMFMDGQGCVVHTVKDHFMYSALIVKFQRPDMKKKLLDTGAQELIEASPGDNYWGECRGYGQNKLGRMLQLIRARAGVSFDATA